VVLCLGGGIGAKGGKAFDARYEIRAQGFGSNLGNVKLVPKGRTPVEAPLAARPIRGADGRFIKSTEGARLNRKTEYPSSYRAGVKEEVLDANTIQGGKHAGKVMAADGERVYKNDPRLNIEHNKPVIEHWNEGGV